MSGSIPSRRAFLRAGLSSLAAARITFAQGARPNVILIVAGQWRAQAVPWANDPNFQNPEIDAPNLKKFGGDSLTFSRAYSCYPSPAPARTAILSGRFPHAPAGPQIGALFGLTGYRAASFTTLQVDDLVSFVHGRGPFFALWEWAEPGGFTRRLDASAMQLRPNVPASLEVRARERLADFYGRVPAWDQDIGILLAALDRPELQDTIVVFTSECGEQMGSQDLLTGDAAYEESVRVPLAIRYPKAWPKGSKSEALVSHADLLPTLLSMCGLMAPAGVQGANLAPLLVEGKGDRPDAVYAEGQAGSRFEWRMLVHGYDKLVTDGEGRVTNLYNLADDPYELNNLATASSEQLKRDALLALKQVWMKRLQDGVDSSGLKIRRG
ncbi:MAG: sulfatase-like hydrolase/transferase [Bryobacteraceae bacterium]